jgi:hypothetical protein
MLATGLNGKNTVTPITNLGAGSRPDLLTGEGGSVGAEELSQTF